MIRIVSLFLVFLCNLLIVPAMSQADDRRVLRFSHVVEENTPKGQMALKFKSIVEERMGHKFVVEVYPNATFCNDEQVFESLLLDDVQFAAPSLSRFDLYSKKLQIFDLPFLFADVAAVRRFQETDAGQNLLLSMEDRGLVGIGYLVNGVKIVASNKKLVKPEDAAGLRFVTQNSKVIKAQFVALGSQVLFKGYDQWFPLLETGTVNCQENSWSNFYASKMGEVQKFITETNHGILQYMVVTSKKFWNGLLPYEQVVLQSAMAEALEYGNELSVQADQNSRKAVLAAKKPEVVELSNSDRVLWVEAMRPVWKQFEAEIGKDLIEEASKANQ